MLSLLVMASMLRTYPEISGRKLRIDKHRERPAAMEQQRLHVSVLRDRLHGGSRRDTGHVAMQQVMRSFARTGSVGMSVSQVSALPMRLCKSKMSSAMR